MTTLPSAVDDTAVWITAFQWKVVEMDRMWYGLRGKGGDTMSRKGFRYEYVMKSIYPQEMGEVIFTYTQYQRKHIDDILEGGPPFKIIFEWQGDGPPVFPRINWPPP